MYSKNHIELKKNANNFKVLKKDINIYYKTADMDEPKFYYQESDNYPGYVALMA